MGSREVWTLTVDPRDSSGIVTTVHNTEGEAQQCLFDNYDPNGLYDGDVQTTIDSECLVVHIQSHELPDDDNTSRVARARRALAEYDDDGLGDASVTDLLADLMHFCEARDIGFSACLGRADTNYSEEI